jgi:hypothetical protein
VLVLALFAAACSSAGQATTTTSAANPAWYPPFIRSTATGPILECTASETTGLTGAEATKIVRQIDVLATGELRSTGACPGGPVLTPILASAEGPHVSRGLDGAPSGRTLAVEGRLVPPLRMPRSAWGSVSLYWSLLPAE